MCTGSSGRSEQRLSIRGDSALRTRSPGQAAPAREAARPLLRACWAVLFVLNLGCDSEGVTGRFSFDGGDGGSTRDLVTPETRVEKGADSKAVQADMTGLDASAGGDRDGGNLDGPDSQSAASARDAGPDARDSRASAADATARPGDAGALLRSDVAPVSSWVAKFAKAHECAHGKLLGYARSADAWHLYDTGYYWEGYVSMYEATGDTRYLDMILEYTDAWMRTAKPSQQAGDSQYQSWVLIEPPTPGHAQYVGKEVSLCEAYGWRFIPKLLYLMRNEPRYQTRYEALREFTEKHIWEKWYSRGTGNMYRSVTHIASHWALMGTYLAKVTSSDAKRLQYQTVTNNISHLGLPNYSGSSLRSQVIDSPVREGANFWNWSWGAHNRPGSDVSHGEAVVTFAVEAHEQGVQQWSVADMRKFAELFNGVIWPAGGPPGGSGYLDGSGSGSGWRHGFAKLGRFNLALQKRLEQQTLTGHCGVSDIGAMAVSARRLRGRRD